MDEAYNAESPPPPSPPLSLWLHNSSCALEYVDSGRWYPSDLYANRLALTPWSAVICSCATLYKLFTPHSRLHVWGYC